MKEIYYLGPKGTYTEQAARMLAERIEEDKNLIELASLEAIARSIDLNPAGIGVMPYYNYLEGLVQECLDIIYEHNLRIIGMQRLHILLSIGAHIQSNQNDVHSHPKALAQCSEWLWRYYKDSRQISSISTAAAAQKVAETRSGLAIASSETLKKYGLELVAEDIGNKKRGRGNFTDFYLVARENLPEYSSSREYLTMVAITPHIDKAGLLAEILLKIAEYGLNNAKIHSRPAPDNVSIEGLEPQMFYLEIVAHQKNIYFEKCIDALRQKLTPKSKDAEVVRVLGSYEKPRN